MEGAGFLCTPCTGDAHTSRSFVFGKTRHRNHNDAAGRTNSNSPQQWAKIHQTICSKRNKCWAGSHGATSHDADRLKTAIKAFWRGTHTHLRQLEFLSKVSPSAGGSELELFALSESLSTMPFTFLTNSWAKQQRATCNTFTGTPIGHDNTRVRAAG